MKTMIFATLFAMAAPVPAAPLKAAVQMWRLDCGTFDVNNLEGRGRRTLTSGCYLIRHGDTYLLWDLGLPGEIAGKPDISERQTLTLNKTIVTQLAEIGVRPEQVKLIGVSHYHGDHTGQAADFPHATLLIGRADYAALAEMPPRARLDPDRIRPWLAGKAAVVQIDSDHDVFGDASVMMLPMPGHTPGHNALLVRLASGAVLLSGDLYHFAEQVAKNEVSGNATDPDAARASMLRFQKIAQDNGAKVIIQHEPADVAKLPAFPKAAR